MRPSILIAMFLTCFATSGSATGEKAGDFDYYVLALSWSPTWCALEGKTRNAPQCAADNGNGWVLHGLWPQYIDGWPSFCPTTMRNPTRAETAAQADLMGSAGNAWHQWHKHGRCTGLSAAEFYDSARAAYDAIDRPDLLRKLDRPIRLPATVIEDAFVEANTALTPQSITITCKSGRIHEARICLTRGFEPTRCTGSVARDCVATDALLDPIDD